MPVDPNTYTMLDYAANSNDPLVKETILCMVGESSLFTDVPMVTRAQMKITGSRITGDLDTPNWVDIGNAPVTSKSPDPEIWEEGLFVHRDAITVDDLLLRDALQINDPFDLRLKTKLKGLSYDLNYKFIQNKHVGTGTRVNAKCFVGLRERLDNPGRWGTNPACLINGNGVDLSTTGGSVDGGQIEYLISTMLYELGSPDGTGVTIAVNNPFQNSFARTVKKQNSGGGFRFDKDALDRTIPMFMNAKIIDAGRMTPTGPKTNRLQTPIISATETADGLQDTGGTFTSIYAYKTGVDSLFGWWFDPMKPSQPYLLPDGVTWQVNLNGEIGIAMPDTRAIARIYNIKLA